MHIVPMGLDNNQGNNSPISLEELNKLKNIAERARKNVVRMLFYDQTIHVGSSLSSIEILTVLLFKYIREDSNPINKDWLILSKGHAAPAYYALLAEKGVIPYDELWKIQDISGILQGHPEISIPTVDMSTGSLGQGLSYGIGVATGIKMSGGRGRVFVVMGDGEHDEGEVWEAITHAPVRKLDNLIVIVDVNGFQLDGSTEEIKPKGYLQKVYEVVGWRTFSCDGHDIISIVNSIEEAIKAKEPSVIFAKTVRGKGFKAIENTKRQRASIDDARSYLINS